MVQAFKQLLHLRLSAWSIMEAAKIILNKITVMKMQIITRGCAEGDTLSFHINSASKSFQICNNRRKTGSNFSQKKKCKSTSLSSYLPGS